MSQLTHLDQQGHAHMVDVSEKSSTARIARAEAIVQMQVQTLQMITDGSHAKGDVFAVARIAGIQAAKKCSDWIPLCHPLMLSKVIVEFTVDVKNSQVKINTLCKVNGPTGVEMEALCAASTAALTLYDMCKAVDRAMTITGLRLVEKKGGKSGHWQAAQS